MFLLYAITINMDADGKSDAGRTTFIKDWRICSPFFTRRNPLLNDFELKYIYIDIPLSLYIYISIYVYFFFFFVFFELQPSSSDQRKVWGSSTCLKTAIWEPGTENSQDFYWYTVLYLNVFVMCNILYYRFAVLAQFFKNPFSSVSFITWKALDVISCLFLFFLLASKVAVYFFSSLFFGIIYLVILEKSCSERKRLRARVIHSQLMFSVCLYSNSSSLTSHRNIALPLHTVTLQNTSHRTPSYANERTTCFCWRVCGVSAVKHSSWVLTPLWFLCIFIFILFFASFTLPVLSVLGYRGCWAQLWNSHCT